MTSISQNSINTNAYLSINNANAPAPEVAKPAEDIRPALPPKAGNQFNQLEQSVINEANRVNDETYMAMNGDDSTYTTMNGDDSTYEAMNGGQATYETPVHNTESSAIFDNPEYGMVAGQYETPNRQEIYAQVDANDSTYTTMNAGEDSTYATMRAGGEDSTYATMRAGGEDSTYATMRAGGEDSTYATMRAGGEDSTYATMNGNQEGIYESIGGVISGGADSATHYESIAPSLPSTNTAKSDSEPMQSHGAFRLLPPPPPITKPIISSKELKAELKSISSHFNDKEISGVKGLFKKSPFEQMRGALNSYQSELKKQSVNNQGDGQRFTNATKIFAKLDKLEQAVLKYQDFMGAKANSPELQKLMASLSDQIDEQRSVVARVLNNQNIAQVDENSNKPHQEMADTNFHAAVNLKILGYDLNKATEVNIDNAHTYGKVLGKGAANEVFAIENPNNEHKLVFKREFGAIQKNLAVDRLLSNEQTHPKFGGRNIATSNIDTALNTNVIAKTQFIATQFIDENNKTHDEFGIAMEKADGGHLNGLKIGDLKKAINDPNFRKDMINLQVMDAITMQLDRHAGNYMIDIKNGQYKGLKGIDNDNCFDSATKPVNIHDLHSGQQKMAGFYGSHNAGLPPLMDKALAMKLSNPTALKALIKQNAEGLISADRLEAALARADDISAHAQTLLTQRRVVSDWNSGKVDNGAKIAAIIMSPHAESSYIQDIAVKLQSSHAKMI